MPSISPKFPPPVTEWTKIPNSYLDHLLPSLTGAELKLLLVIQRKAYGYLHIELPLNVTVEELADWTGLTRSGVILGLRSLKRNDLILRFKSFPHQPKSTAQKSSNLRSKTGRPKNNNKEMLKEMRARGIIHNIE